MPKSKKSRKTFAGSKPSSPYVPEESDRKDLSEEYKSVKTEISDLEFKLDHDCGCYTCMECIDIIVDIRGLESRMCEIETALEDLDSGRNENI